MHQLYSSQCILRRVETLEAQHRPALAFDVPVILFDDVVVILARADFDTLVVFIVVALNRRRVRTAFIDVDQTRFPVSADGFGKETECRFLIPFGCKQEIDGVTLFIDGTNRSKSISL